MQKTITPDFNEQAWFAPRGHGNGNESDTNADSGADSGGLLTLEMRDNSFQVFMNRIDWLMNTGLAEDLDQAYELTRQAWMDADFGADREQILQDRLERIIKIMTEDRILGGVFARSAAGMQTAEPCAPSIENRPVLAYNRQM